MPNGPHGTRTVAPAQRESVAGRYSHSEGYIQAKHWLPHTEGNIQATEFTELVREPSCFAAVDMQFSMEQLRLLAKESSERTLAGARAICEEVATRVVQEALDRERLQRWDEACVRDETIEAVLTEAVLRKLASRMQQFEEHQEQSWQSQLAEWQRWREQQESWTSRLGTCEPTASTPSTTSGSPTAGGRAASSRDGSPGGPPTSSATAGRASFGRSRPATPPSSVDIKGFITDYRNPEASALTAAEAVAFLKGLLCNLQTDLKDLLDIVRSLGAVSRRVLVSKLTVYLREPDRATAGRLKTALEQELSKRDLKINGLSPRVSLETEACMRQANREAARLYQVLEQCNVPKECFRLVYERSSQRPTSIAVYRMTGRPSRMISWSLEAGWTVIPVAWDAVPSRHPQYSTSGHQLQLGRLLLTTCSQALLLYYWGFRFFVFVTRGLASLGPQWPTGRALRRLFFLVGGGPGNSPI